MSHCHLLLLLLSGLEDLERAEQALIHAHHSTRIVEFTAVVWRAEQSDKLSLGEELVSVLDDLMRSADEVHVVFLQESRDDIGAEGERNTTIVFAPASDVLVGVGPEQVAQETAVRDL